MVVFLLCIIIAILLFGEDIACLGLLVLAQL